jgi:methyl-accepting chemotaxis protein
MSFLNNLSIGKKINGGFGSAVLLLVIIAAVVVMSLFSVNGSFVEFRRLAFSANDVGQVQANMLQTSLGVKDFIINGTDESIDRVRKSAQETVRLADAALKQEDDPARRKVIESVQKKVNAYAAAFETVTALQGKRVAVMKTMTTVGPTIEKSLFDIMASAYEGGNVNAAYFAGLALRDVLLGRLHANRYLVENSEKAFERASEALDAFSESSLIMMTNFEKPEYQELGEKAIAAAEKYQSALIDVFKPASETMSLKTPWIRTVRTSSRASRRSRMRSSNVRSPLANSRKRRSKRPFRAPFLFRQLPLSLRSRRPS